ncbi:MAG TPA: deoxynucleoside kinase [Polyangia bacterium]|nr:deoxynucleoside kinase [Polyangia bacterium]
MADARYIAIEGPPGVGKRKVARALARRLEARLSEGPSENPFLPGFYADRRRNALQTQLFFLLARYQQQAELGQADLFAHGRLVADYLLVRDRIYAGLTLSHDELILYKKVYGLLAPRVPRPDLVVYLQARPEVLLGRIRKRALTQERLVTLDYVEEVAKAYHGFFFHWAESPLLVVDMSEVDLAADMEELLAIIGRHRAGVQHYIPTLGSRR